MEAFRKFGQLADAAQLVEARKAELEAAQRAYRDAWAQVLDRAADMYRRGELTMDDLIDLVEETGRTHGPGYTRVWDAHMPIPYLRGLKRQIGRRWWRERNNGVSR